ncbi:MULTISPECIES: glutathione S-transferase family protein [Variovorax]|jgi:glutathione S-transferase|uniref:glutathione S-transferase family protein n=1 Tax=Variovorax TaxID=34072 RepID=UPI00078671AB|nr:glutathione S-transferase N-terminal domain-containing protein [Variovorax paradoxus]MBW8715720.1 glutathione S-transferase N-terminal domain-containing protein [Variovorax paradoxus]MBW8891725.1 glutathione S-transferase N-terminal domain-containing protein [Burkholderiales bacterium]
MKLYHMPGACSLADLIVLQWIGADHEPVRMSLDSIKSPDYLAINPGGTVPLLAHGDLSLTENVAILGYLADLYPEARLLGDGSPRARAEVMRWLGFLNSDVHKAFKPIFTPQRFLKDAAMAPLLADNARGHVREYLARLDGQLEGRDWLTGERSIADPYLFVLSRWSAAKKVDMQGLDNLARFARMMDADAGVQAALDAERSMPQ